MLSPLRDLPLEPWAIRPAAIADAEAVRHFKRLALGETEYLLQGLEDFDDRVDAERDLIGRYLHQPNCLLLLAVSVRGPVLGMCSVVGGHLWRTRHVGTMSVAVLRRCWRRGIARELMQETVEWARDRSELAKLSLQVHATNTAARGLYASLGFAEEGLLRSEARLGEGFDDLVPMGLLLHGALPRPRLQTGKERP